MHLDFLRKHFGRGRRRHSEVAHQSSLEERVDDTPLTTVSAERAQDNYDHEDVVTTLIKASYSTRELNKRIQSTSNRGELNKLGYEIRDKNPRLATDIFVYTGDEKGKQEMKPRLFNSSDPDVLSYAYVFACEQSPYEKGLATLKEFGKILHKKDKYKICPSAAFAVGEKTGDVNLAAKALREIRRTNPEEAERLTPTYENLRKTPVPSATLLKTYKPKPVLS